MFYSWRHSPLLLRASITNLNVILRGLSGKGTVEMILKCYDSGIHSVSGISRSDEYTMSSIQCSTFFSLLYLFSAKFFSVTIFVGEHF